MMLWDIAGTEDLFSVPIHFIKGSAGYLLVMDGTRRESIEVGLDLVKLVNDNVGVAKRICCMESVGSTSQCIQHLAQRRVLLDC